ncbi:MAG TPA: FtsX-like permease family protein [bacterium]|jgi:ABC-type lipoprotein release transport system permease subunit|nr:FtsX-like permease family protein [bacterium]
MNTVQLAVRNVERKRARLLVTAGAMGLAGAFVIFFSCLVDGFYTSMVGNVIDNECAHLQAHAPGWRADPDLYGVLDADPAALDASGLAWAPRLDGFGLAAKGDASAGMEMRGLDLRREPRVSKLGTRVALGRWLDAADPKGVVLGWRLARKLEAKPGDELVLLSQAADGSVANDLVRVRGVLESVSARTDEAALLAPEGFFRDFFQLPKGWHEVAVRLPGDAPDLEAGRAALKRALPGAEVLTWKELLPAMAGMVRLEKAVLFVFMAIAYLAVGLVVFNAMLMGVFERIREFGVMKALGVGPGRVAAIIAVEAVLEAALAAVLAAALGLALAWFLHGHPLDLSGLMPQSSTLNGMAFDPRVGAELSLRSVLTPLAFLFVLSLVAVAYPAYRAATLDPLAAIQHH